MLLSIISFVLLNTALVHYFYKLKQNKALKNPIFLKLSMFTGSCLSIWAISTLFTEPTSTLNIVIVALIAFSVLSTSVSFLIFLLTKTTPIGNIKVSVGEQFLPFNTPDFNSATLMGKRTFVKFYRGAWCPYCSAELVMFEALKPQLSAYNIQVLAISSDTTEQQQAHRIRDNISHTLVSDVELDIIRQYGVEHHKALGANADDTINILGIAMPLPWKMRHKSMSIPTSMLINELGTIVWIDQSEDYRLRASEDAVMAAVQGNFDK